MADLKLSDLHVNYGSFVALKNVSLKVHRGELVVLLGANGAGKSTMFRAISGLTKPSRGGRYASGINGSTAGQPVESSKPVSFNAQRGENCSLP
ncbi:ABC transporter [Melghirimyces thermohalophilus]|uniref:ABC transporter n=1 Tax=Melghirimyces thermohalophilus TaxID=1236220 RepID=A0A1G6IQ15_9BACL|nr:ABC transporter [Melghirimyces thermohalophilus]